MLAVLSAGPGSSSRDLAHSHLVTHAQSLTRPWPGHTGHTCSASCVTSPCPLTSDIRLLSRDFKLFLNKIFA